MTPRPLLIAALPLLLVGCYHFRSWRVRDDATPPELYVQAGCAACHGDERWGTDRGPELRELAAHWTVEALAAYIEAPAERRDERLDALDARFETDMPAAAFLSLEQREALAEWLLGYN